MVDPWGEEDIEEQVKVYRREGEWSEQKDALRATGRAITTLVESIVEHYPGEVGSTELSTLLRVCQVEHSASDATKKERVADLDIPKTDIEAVQGYIDQGTGIVGGGRAKIDIPTEHEEDAYELLEALITADSPSELDAAIDRFAALEIKGVQAGVLSPIFYFLHPDRYPVVNKASREGLEAITGEEVSSQLSDYTDEAARFREFRDRYELGGEDDDLRDVDWFLYTMTDEDGNGGGGGEPPRPEPEPDTDRFSRSLGDDPQMFQSPLSAGDMWANYQQTVEDDVPVASIEGVVDTEFDTSTVRLWGSGADGEAAEPGDLVLFADRRSDDYITAATVRGSERLSSSQAKAFCDAVGWRYSEPYRFILYFEEVYEIELDAAEFWDLMEYEGFPQDGFSRIWPARIEDHILGPEGYDSVDGFLEDIAVRRIHPTDDASPRYFWLNTEGRDLGWLDEQDSRFYSHPTPTEDSDGVATPFQRAERGDHVIVSDTSTPEQVVGIARVERGLHTQSEDGGIGSEDGITIVGERRIDGPTWDSLRDDSDLQDLAPMAADGRPAMVELDEAEFHQLIEITMAAPRKRLRRRLTPPEFSITLPDELYFDDAEELERQIQASLNSGKHIIFTGPPGTGKTKLAKAIAGLCASEHPDLITDHRFTTATSAWTTFDTIGGYVPRRVADGDELVFQPRLFLNCFRDGRIRNDWLVIDEINRSDIDKAFGQLFSVLSGDSVELPYERDSPVEIVSLDNDDVDDERLDTIVEDPDIFPVTPSWRLLATMNTYDKASLYELSYAFMRRFNFIHVGVPDLETEDGIVRSRLLDPAEPDGYASSWIEADPALEEPLAATYRELAVIWQKVNEARTIGPSIVQDMVAYIEASGTVGTDDRGEILTDAIISLVYPQLEGMRPKEQRQLIGSLSDDGVQTQDGEVDLELEQGRLRSKAADMFDWPFEDDE